MRRGIKEVLSLFHGNFTVITICTLITFPWIRAFYPYESVYLKALGASSFIIGLLSAINRLIGVITTIPGGYFADIYGRRRVIIIGSSMTAMARFLIALSLDWKSYFISSLILSITSFWSVAESTILVDSIRVGKRGLGFAIYWATMQIAGLFSPYIGGLILETRGAKGLRYTLFLIAVADTVKTMVYARYLKETLRRRENEKFEIGSLFTSFINTFRTLKSLSRPIKGFCILSVINGYAWAMIMPFIVLYALEVISLSPVEWGIISTTETAVILLFRIPGGIVADRYNRKALLLIATLADLSYFIVFILSRSFLQVLIAIIARRIIVTLAEPAWSALQADLVPKEQRGRVFSLLNILSAIPGSIGSIVGGYLFDLNPALPFYAFLPFNIIAFLILYLYIEEPRKS